MKFEERKIIVLIGDGDDAARITFVEPLENERLKIAEIGKENIRLALQIIYKNCVAVDNLYVEDNEITVEDIRSGNIRGTVADAIAVGYFTAIAKYSEGDAEKKS